MKIRKIIVLSATNTGFAKQCDGALCGCLSPTPACA